MLHSVRRRGYGAYLFFLAATVSLLCASAVARAQTPDAPPSAIAQPAPGDALSIGPGLFTFGQIAALLSTPEQSVTCDFSLKDRAAYVFLQRRTRPQAKELLGAGLQITFVADEKTKGVTMARQKAVAEREAQWLKRLARLFQNEWQKKLQEVISLSEQPFPDQGKRARLTEEIEKLTTAVGEPPYAAPPATDVVTRQRAQAADLIAQLDAEYRLPTAAQRTLAAWAQNSHPDFASLIQGKDNDLLQAQPVPPQWLGNGLLKNAILSQVAVPTGIHLDALPAGFGPESYQWLTGYQLVPRLQYFIDFSAQGRLVHQPNATSKAVAESANALLAGRKDDAVLSDAAKEAEKQATVVYYLNQSLTSGLGIRLPSDDASVPERVPIWLFLLGHDAVDWWTQEQADTDHSLKTLPGDLSAPSLSAPLPDPKATREIIMELHPRAELWQAAGNADAYASVPSLAAWVHPPKGVDQWSVRENDKVLLITNRLAFTERPQNTPLGEWIRFHEDLQQWHEKNDAAFDARYPKTGTSDRNFINGFYPYEPLADYAREVIKRRDGRTWQVLGSSNAPSKYHGMYLRALDAAVPTVFLWDKLAEKERERLLTRLETPTPDSFGRFSKARLPLSRFSDATLITLAQLLRERGWMDADWRNREFMTYLRSGTLYIVLYIDPAVTMPGYHAVQARLLFDAARPTPDVRTDVQFLMAVPPSEKSVAPAPETP